MAKQQMYQQFIYKLHSTRILKANNNLSIDLNEARKNREIISLADSNTLRMVDIINHCDRKSISEEIKQIKFNIKQIKKLPKSIENSKKIKEYYKTLDKAQHKIDYVSIIMDNPKDIDKLDKGFKINDIEYHRLVGTTNGVKKSTVVYSPIINDKNNKIYDDLTNRMDNGRDKSVKLVPAKFEAYKSLTCSASIPVSTPKGVLVVDDLTVTCKEKVIKLDDADNNKKEPSIEENDELEELEIIDSDGYGVISPSLSKQWATDINEDYLPSGFCIRNSFCKGMVFTFDFHEFADKIAHKEIINDIWGNPHNIKDIDIIITASMLKLWSSYKSIDDYLENCKKNDYTFSVTKVCPEKLENERNMNYQFLQSYQLTDDEIEKLLEPTISEIKDVISGDIDKTILFLKGSTTDDNFNFNDSDYIVQSLMVNPLMAKDPYIINRINYMIKKKINEAKIGVIKVHGNYAIISGDPYALCQYIFGCEVSNDEYGLLRTGQIYAKYWSDENVDKIACFRAPMSCHNNIRIMNVTAIDDMKYWYRYMKTVNILNCHDSVTMAENGADKDSDCFITTNNEIILNNTRETKTIVCAQKNAEKVIITDELLKQSNKNGFGDAIGKITNRITTMYDLQAKYSKDSIEYKTLDYRIMCGQLLQQNAIDKTKGIISKPMPKFWYDPHSVKIDRDKDDEETIKEKMFNQSILADKKPYFMCYIYPQDMTKYKNYIKNNKTKCYMLFGISLDELRTLCNNNENINELTDERDFLNWYDKLMPYGLNNCVMNKICWYVENAFDGYLSNAKTNGNFDYTIMKQGIEYSQNDYKKLKNVYKSYMNEMSEYSSMASKYRLDSEETSIQKTIMTNRYKIECDNICGAESTQCDILLDMCYKSEKSKKFVWDMRGETIVRNLLRDNDNMVTYYVPDENGSIYYCGEYYGKRVKEVKI